MVVLMKPPCAVTIVMRFRAITLLSVLPLSLICMRTTHRDAREHPRSDPNMYLSPPRAPLVFRDAHTTI